MYSRRAKLASHMIPMKPKHPSRHPVRALAPLLGHLILATGLSAARAHAAEPVKIGRTPDGRSVVSFTVPLSREEGSLAALFDFGLTKGFLGPSTNPSDQSGICNADRSLVAVNHQPVTKCSHVHVFLRSPDGDLTFLNNVNGRVARLLERRWAQAAGNFLRVESISGRVMTLETVDFSGTVRERHRFNVSVLAGGSLALAR
jgi:hypothetical protein